MRGGLRVLAALALSLAPPSLRAQQEEIPLLLTADELTYDQELGIAVAVGNVEVTHGERVLLADTLSYSQPADLITASGNVVLLEPTGEVLFGEYVELSGDLRRGAITGLGMLLADRSRMAAAGGRRLPDGSTELARAVYSPCDLCPDDPTRAPLWQISAVRVVHDAERQEVRYTDATLQLFGVPVAWLPYFSHPDPAVRRKSGFLGPRLGSNTFLGRTIQTPYFWAVAPNIDATIAPIFTTEQGVVLVGEYRHALPRSGLNASGSVTRQTDPTEDIRGHFALHGRHELDDAWMLGIDAERASDATYLAQYNFRRTDFSLRSRIFGRRMVDRSFTEISGLSFQSLDPLVDPDTVPIVAPYFEYRNVSEPSEIGAQWLFDANAMVLSRRDGTDSRRLSTGAAWRLPYRSSFGELYTITAGLRGDLYHVENFIDPANIQREGVTGRIVPELALDWRLPMVRHGENFSQVITPIAQAFLSPHGVNPADIPNEDSQDVELDDANLFMGDRFPGRDRVEAGPRANYGIRGDIYGPRGSLASILVGQSFGLRREDLFEPGTGLDRDRSDVVGRITLTPSPFLTFSYRARLDSEDFSPRRHVLNVVGGPSRFRLGANYISIRDDPTVANPITIENLTVHSTIGITPHWSVRGVHQRDLRSGVGGPLLTLVDLTYQDECITVMAQFRRDFFRGVGIEPATSFLFEVHLRNLS